MVSCQVGPLTVTFVFIHTKGCLFSRATNFTNGLKKKVWGNYFHESTLVSSFQSVICVMIEFLLIFGDTNFVEVSKIHKICSPQKRPPVVNVHVFLWWKWDCFILFVKKLHIMSAYCSHLYLGYCGLLHVSIIEMFLAIKTVIAMYSICVSVCIRSILKSVVNDITHEMVSEAHHILCFLRLVRATTL